MAAGMCDLGNITCCQANLASDLVWARNSVRAPAQYAALPLAMAGHATLLAIPEVNKLWCFSKLFRVGKAINILAQIWPNYQEMVDPACLEDFKSKPDRFLDVF